MADDDEDVAALVVDNGSGMCKGASDLDIFIKKTTEMVPNSIDGIRDC